VSGAPEQGFVFYSQMSPPEFQLRAGFSFATSFATSFARRFAKAVHEAWRTADIILFNLPARQLV
jgi:hypothetical protein